MIQYVSLIKYGLVSDFIAKNNDDTPWVLIKFTIDDEFKVIFNLDADTFYAGRLYCELRVTKGEDIELLFVLNGDNWNGESVSAITVVLVTFDLKLTTIKSLTP